MIQFPPSSIQQHSSVYLEDTDRALPLKLDPNLRYAYFKTIAKGGKSLIQACKDMHLSRVICYKTLLPEFADDPIEQQRLLREARISAILQHPNTVPTYEVGRNKKGHYYFTMKLIDGYTFREVLDYRERYDLTQLINVIIQIAYALEYAHTYGVIHRDLKPENILVGQYGEVLLLDWGLAKVWRATENNTAHKNDAISKDDILEDVSITQHGKLQGTVTYMSPEQLENDPTIDYRTDIYSLGTIIYEILCGHNSAPGDKVDQVIASIKNDEPIPPSKLSKFKIPPKLEQLSMKCLKKKPAERPQSMHEIIQDLKADWQ